MVLCGGETFIEFLRLDVNPIPKLFISPNDDGGGGWERVFGSQFFWKFGGALNNNCDFGHIYLLSR
jgi:hypothetical protein